MYKRILQNPASKEQYFVNVDDTGVSIILPNTGKVVLDSDGFVNLLNYLNGYDYTLALQERGYYYAKNKNPLGYFSEVEDEGTLVLVDITLSSGKIPDVTFKTILLENGKITSELSMNSVIFGKVISYAATKGLVATAPVISKIVSVDKLPAETSAQRNTVYFNDSKYYILNAAEDALVLFTKPVLTMDSFPATEAPGKANVLYNLTDEFTQNNIKYTRGLYTYNTTKNEYALQDLSLVKVEKLPDVKKAKTNSLYLLTKDEKNEGGQTVHAKGTAWKLSENAFVEETRKIITTGKLNIKEIADEHFAYLVNGTLSNYTAATKKFTAVGKVVSVKTLPDVTKIQLSNDVVYVLTKDDGDKTKGSKWIFNLKTKEFDEFEPVEEEEVEGSGGGLTPEP